MAFVLKTQYDVLDNEMELWLESAAGTVNLSRFLSEDSQDRLLEAIARWSKK